MKFVLPYIIAGQPKSRSFMEVDGFDTISAAAASCEVTLREKYTKLLKKAICVAVAEIDFTFRDRETGKQTEEQRRAEVLSRAPKPAYRPQRRRRNQGGVWYGAAAAA